MQLSSLKYIKVFCSADNKIFVFQLNLSVFVWHGNENNETKEIFWQSQKKVSEYELNDHFNGLFLKRNVDKKFLKIFCYRGFVKGNNLGKFFYHSTKT